MLEISTVLKYPLLILLSIGKKSFENMGRYIRKSGDTIARLLQPASVNFSYAQKICQSMFRDKKKLFLIIDDTLIKKIFSQFMEGSGKFFDTKVGRRITAYRLVLGMISDGKFAIPIDAIYLFSNELVDMMDKKPRSKEAIAQGFIELAIKLFPNTKIIVLADGLYATVNFLQWCIANKVAAEMRMHSNRVIIFNGQKIALKKLIEQKGMCPKGRQMARTISVVWHELSLEITIVRRLDKNDKESIVFQVATYKSLPREHVANYKKRWPVEMTFRTTKQHLGLQECFSTSLETQHNHVAAVFLAYALAQLEMKNRRLKTPEEAIRRLKTKNVIPLIEKFADFYRSYQQADA
jgi:hypothetical protein